MGDETKTFGSAPPILTNAKDPFAVAQWAAALVRWLTVRVLPEGTGTIDSDDIEDGGIATVDLADNCVTNPKMADNSVNTPEIVDNAVTNPKMADNSVNTPEIVNNAVTTAKIADNNVTAAKLQDMAQRYLLCGSDAGTVAAYVSGDIGVYASGAFCSMNLINMNIPVNVDGELMFGVGQLTIPSPPYEFVLLCVNIPGT